MTGAPNSVRCRSVRKPPPTSAADRPIRRSRSTGCFRTAPATSSTWGGHRQADHPAGGARPRRRCRRPDSGDARAAEHVAARHPGAAWHRRGDPAARRQRRRGAGGPGVALVRPGAGRQGGGPRAAARRPARVWCGTTATNVWAGSRIWAASSATRSTRSPRPRVPAPFTGVERQQVEWTSYLTPQALIDLVASRSYCITSPERGAGAHAGPRPRAAGHPSRAGQRQRAGAAVRDGVHPRHRSRLVAPRACHARRMHDTSGRCTWPRSRRRRSR